jgi:4-amino-4-deoxy-L-arabinose transferase-like glycosyltransferase
MVDPVSPSSPAPVALSLSTARRWAVAVCLLITAWRLIELFSNPINLSFDEAQYWGWAQDLDWGYFSKPPMIAWVIWLTTTIGQSDAEPWVRLGATLAHLITALALFTVGRRLAPASLAPWAGFWSAVMWIIMPGVAISAMVISTDAFLLMFWALALVAYERALATGRLRWWLLLGIWLGLGLLSKYAMAFFILGMAVHLLWSSWHRDYLRYPWRNPGPVLAILIGVALYTPNWLWNRAHGFASYHHTGENANLDHGNLFNLDQLGEFIASQFGVFGPFLFGALLVLLLWRARRALSDHAAAGNGWDLAEGRRLLIALSLPPLLLICVQAFLSRANANWAATAYVAATPLVVGWLLSVGKPWRHLLTASLVLNLVASLALYDLEALAHKAGVSEPARYDLQKRVRGWDEGGAWVRELKHQNPGLSLLYVDRKVMASMLYYAQPEGWDSVIFNPERHVMNHYELTTTMDKREGEDFLLISRDPPDANFSSFFTAVQPIAVFRKPIHPKYTLVLYAYWAKGFLGNDHHD